MGAIGLTVAKLYFQRQPLRFTLWKSCLSNLTANLYGGGGGGGAIRSTNLFNFAKQPYWGKAPHWAFCGWSHNEEPYFNMVA